MTNDQESVGPGPRDGTVEPWARPLGAAITGAFALALLGLAGFYLYELAIGAGDSPVRVVMSMVLFLVFAAVGAAMARGWWRGLTWPATPTLVIGALFVPTAWTLVQSGSVVPGLLVGAAGVAGVVVGWKGRTAPE